MDDQELADRERELLEEIEDYNREREQIRKMLSRVGRTGYSRRDAVVNSIFLVVVVVLFLLSFALHLIPTIVSLEIGVLLVSIKIVWMIYAQHKFNHFLFWILHSLEYRVNDIAAVLKETASKRDGPGHSGT